MRVIKKLIISEFKTMRVYRKEISATTGSWRETPVAENNDNDNSDNGSMNVQLGLFPFSD